MQHQREEVIQRTIREYELLDKVVAALSDEEWALPVPRPETKAPWTIKDSLAHITHWKASTARSARKQPQPAEEQGLNETDQNKLVYLRWRDRSPQDVLAWHRQVHVDMLAALTEAPDKWFNGKDRKAEWPFDLDGHVSEHRVKDIERALAARHKA